MTELDAGREALAGAASVLVFTGAGMSADSGVPTFRGSGGLWRNFRPEELATRAAFDRDPLLVWEWYNWRRRVVLECEPHAGHRAIARAQAEGRVRLVTQNVDGLHQRALAEIPERSQAVPTLALHGSLFRLACIRCDYSRTDTESIDTTSPASLPECPECRHLLRPGVVWFGEQLDQEVLSAAFSWATNATACLVVGTSAVVEPAASIPRLVLQNGGTVVEVNAEPTPLSGLATVAIQGSAAELVPAILGTGA